MGLGAGFVSSNDITEECECDMGDGRSMRGDEVSDDVDACVHTLTNGSENGG